MEIISMNPIYLVQETDITKTTIVQDKDEYICITFHDDTDDALSVPQTIKIHAVDFDKFVQLQNRAINLL